MPAVRRPEWGSVSDSGGPATPPRDDGSLTLVGRLREAEAVRA